MTRPTEREAIDRLAVGADLEGLGLKRVEGRFDLRGLDMSGEEVVLRDVVLQHLDLREAVISGWRFFDCTVVDCRLDRADCRDWRLWNCEVRQCSFFGANLDGAAVGTWQKGRGNRWERVDLREAKFRVGVSWAARYTDCDFNQADLSRVSFEQCALTRCRFGGDLHEVMFDGRGVADRPPSPPLDQVDFSGAHFDRVEFLGFTLEGVLLPDDPDLRMIRRFPCAVERALSRLAADQSTSAQILRTEFEGRLVGLRGRGHPDDANVLNRRDYLLSGGETLAELAIDTLTGAEAECLQAR